MVGVRAIATDPTRLADGLDSCSARNLVLTIGKDKYGDGSFARVYDADAKYPDVCYLSTRASTPMYALAMMIFALENAYVGFPDDNDPEAHSYIL